MKNTIKFFGITALAAVIMFGMAACDVNPDSDNNFIGSWSGTYNSATVSGTITADAWTISIPSMSLEATGEYSLVNSTTANIKNGSGDVIGTAVLSNNNNTLTITITEEDGGLPDGTEIVVTRSIDIPNNFIGSWSGTFGEASVSGTITADEWTISIPSMIEATGGYSIIDSTNATIENNSGNVIGTAVLSNNNNTLTITITEENGGLPNGTEIVVTKS